LSAGGDSGGPHFNAAKEIVGVTSYGITITACQPDPPNPPIPPPPGVVTDVTCDLDSSFGEWGVDTRVASYVSFIDTAIANAQPFCGDGVVNQPSEQCDDLNLPTPTCDITCQNIVQPFCGDGIVNQPTEQCDDLNLPTPTCDITCQNIIVVPPCQIDSDCDDGQFCTLDTCVAGVCVFNQNPDPSCERVGGEFIGVDNSALLVAGFQANALWLLPAIAAIGIAAVVIRRIH